MKFIDLTLLTLSLPLFIIAAAMFSVPFYIVLALISIVEFTFEIIKLGISIYKERLEEYNA
jgi:hypothetical protein